MTKQPTDEQNKAKRSVVSPWTIIQSVFAGFVGIQKEANRQRDFESGKFWHFVVAGIAFVVIFLLLVWGAVQYLLATT